MTDDEAATTMTTLLTTLFTTRTRSRGARDGAASRCAHCGTTTGPGVTVCRDCGEEARCTVCRAHLYRVSLIDGHVESLDHADCALLVDAA